MWLFVTTVGVEPTNNAAERVIRTETISLKFHLSKLFKYPLN